MIPPCPEELYEWSHPTHVKHTPYMEYASHVWGGSTHIALLDRVESKAFRLIDFSLLTDCLQSLSHRRNVASLTIYYRYFHANCSSNLANCMPSLHLWPRCTMLSSFSHSYAVHLSNARVYQRKGMKDQEYRFTLAFRGGQ